MSVQPSLYSPAPAEPAPARPRAADRDREPTTFTLPDDTSLPEPAREPEKAAAPARDDKATKDDKTVVAKDEAAATPAGQEAAAPPAPAGTVPAKTVATDAPAKPAPATTAAATPLDIGALVAIAAASAPAGPTKAVTDEAPGEAKTDKAKSEGEAGDAAAAETIKPELDATILIAVVSSPDAPTQAQTPALALALAAIVPPPAPAIEAGAAADAAAIEATAAGATAAAQGVTSAALSGKTAVVKPVANKAALALSGDAAAAPAPAEAGDGKTPAPASGEQAGVHAAKETSADPAAPVAAHASGSAEFKPLEALQLGQQPIDLSALVQHRAGKQDAMTTASAGPEQAALQQGVTGQGQTVSSQPTPLHVLPVEIGMKAMAGMKQFDIRLDPAELGRVDVSLDISDKGEVSARLVVDRVETLHLLQRDARTLERAFEQAGLKPSDAGVEISLRDPSDQSTFRQQRQQDDAPRRSRAGTSEGGEDDIAISAQPTPVRLIRLGGVDLSI